MADEPEQLMTCERGHTSYQRTGAPIVEQLHPQPASQGKRWAKVKRLIHPIHCPDCPVGKQDQTIETYEHDLI